MRAQSKVVKEALTEFFESHGVKIEVWFFIRGRGSQCTRSWQGEYFYKKFLDLSFDHSNPGSSILLKFLMIFAASWTTKSKGGAPRCKQAGHARRRRIRSDQV